MEDDIIVDEQLGEVLQTVRDMNYDLHAQTLYFPILDGFKLMENDDPQSIYFAEKDGYLEQLVSDGYCEESEFEERIENVIDSTRAFMNDSGCERVEDSFRYYKDSDNGVFKFKTYVCDTIIPIKGARLITRQFISFFIEPIMKDFYQITISSSPVTMPPEEIIIEEINIEKDKVTKKLNEYMDKVIEDLEYRKD